MTRFVIVLLLMSSFSLSKAGATTDSITFLSPKDTIFLMVGDLQEKMFTHTVKEKQTLYSISKFYGLSLETIYYYNPSFRSKVLSIDDLLIIPLPNRSIIRYRTIGFDESQHVPICYKVRAGDNLFRIARVHFKMPVDSVMLRNNLSNHQIHIGEVLQLGWMNINGIPAKYQQNKRNLERIRNEQTKQRFKNYTTRKGKRTFEDKGIAYWKKNARQQTQLFALHRTAAINSLISVENPMQKKVVLVKVIGGA